MNEPPRILIADDNRLNVDILRTRLAAHGYEVVTAADGEEALAVACKALPDLVLLDYMMPKLDGVEVCRRLRGDAALPFIPIIMVTARTAAADAVAALEAGCDEYLAKPVDQVSLVARVKSMLRIKALQDRVQEQAERLRMQSAILAEQNRALEQQVKDQVAKLTLASDIQRNLLPLQPPTLPGYEISARSIPAQIVGGDYFDFVQVTPSSSAICLGDVSGKGLPAAMIMANLQATIRSHASLPPTGCLARSNALLARSVEPGRYATLFYSVLDWQEHRLTYANAGHNPPMLVRASGAIERLPVGGTPLGMFEEATFEQAAAGFEPGDLLVAFSDGITEPLDEDDQEFGEERLADLALEYQTRPVADLIENLVTAARLHSRNRPQMDDMTLVAVKRLA